jgi:hypothetical protein
MALSQNNDLQDETDEESIFASDETLKVIFIYKTKQKKERLCMHTKTPGIIAPD